MSRLRLRGWSLLALVLSAPVCGHGLSLAGHPAKAAAHPKELEGFEVAGGLSRAKLEVGERVRFWLTVHNPSSTRVLDLRWVAAEIPEYEVLSRSWCAPPIAAGSVACDQLAGTVEPGQQLAFYGELRAVRDHAAKDLFIILRWNGEKEAESRAAVLLGRSEVLTYWGAAGQWWRSFFEDFGLPILLAVLGFAFARWEKKRDVEREAREKARDAAREAREQARQQAQEQAEKQLEQERQQAEKERDIQRQNKNLEQARMSETWNLMLPESHRLAMRFYVLLQQAARTMLEALQERELLLKQTASGDEVAPAGDAARAEELTGRAFYAFCLFHRRARHLTDQAGGFYFKDRTGEEIVRQCHADFNRSFLRGHEEVRLRYGKVLSLMDPNEANAAFDERLRSPDQQLVLLLQKARADFVEWLGSAECAAGITALRAFRLVMAFEMNRPYELWYGSPEKLTLDAETETYLGNMAERVEEKDVTRTGFARKVADYAAQSRS